MGGYAVVEPKQMYVDGDKLTAHCSLFVQRWLRAARWRLIPRRVRRPRLGGGETSRGTRMRLLLNRCGCSRLCRMSGLRPSDGRRPTHVLAPGYFALSAGNIGLYWCCGVRIASAASRTHCRARQAVRRRPCLRVHCRVVAHQVGLRRRSAECVCPWVRREGSRRHVRRRRRRLQGLERDRRKKVTKKPTDDDDIKRPLEEVELEPRCG